DRTDDGVSTGMEPRVGLARGIVHDAPVLILDEPTNGLGPVVSHTVEQAVKELARAGKCVLFSTHVLTQAEELCDRVGIMGNGRVLAEGTIAEICAARGADDLRRAFFSLIEEHHVAA